MMRPSLSSLIALAVSGGLSLLPLAAAMAQASAPAQAAPGTVHVRGTVVDGVTGKPIARALVTSSDRRLAAMTNNEGVFALEVEVLAPAQGGAGGGITMPPIFLTAQRPGYLQQMRVARVLLNSSLYAAPLRLKLMPAAAVAGHVLNVRNEAAHGVSVNLLLHSTNNGELTWNRIANHRTNADGSYSFSGLSPGEYTVMTEEWRGEQPLPPQRDAVTEQYPPVFLGDAADLASANKLSLHFGETAQANLALHTATYYPVSVPVTGNADGFVNVRITGSDALTGFHLGYAQGRHAVEGSLPDGTYGLELTSYPAAANNRQVQTGRGQAPERSFGVTSIHIAGAPVHAAAVALVAPSPISVRVHREFDGKDIPEHFQTRVTLQPVEQGQSFVNGSSDEGSQDEMTLPGAAPGQYSVHVEPTYGYAAQVRCGGVDLRAEKLAVNSGGSQPIDVVLRDDTATVDGTVQGGAGQPDEWTQLTNFAVLTPVDGDGRFSMANTAPDGHFSMPNVPPGRYRLFAIGSSFWGMPNRDPEALQRFRDKGVAVNVTANAKLQVEAPVLDAAALEMK